MLDGGDGSKPEGVKLLHLEVLRLITTSVDFSSPAVSLIEQTNNVSSILSRQPLRFINSAARLAISARRVRPSEWRPLWSGSLARSSKRFLTGSWCGPSLKSFGPLSDAIESFWGNSAVPLGEASANTSDMPWAVTACPRPSSPSKPTATSSTEFLSLSFDGSSVKAFELVLLGFSAHLNEY